MRGALAFAFALACAAPALAQSPYDPPEQDVDEEALPEPTPADDAEPDPPPQIDPPSAPPQIDPPSTPPPRATSSPSSRVAEDAAVQESPRVVVVRHGRERSDDDEEPPADTGDPYDIVWIELFGGASYVDLRAIDGTDYFPEIVRLSGFGPAGGLAIGFRVEFFSFGVRAALARYDASDPMTPNAVFDVGTVAAEVKLALPIPIVQPFLRVGFGMGWHGNSNVQDTWTMGAPPSDIQTTVFGWVFQAAVGLDIYLVHWFAIGGAFSLELLNMSRQAIEDATDVSLRNAGDAIGIQGRAQGAISFHF